MWALVYADSNEIVASADVPKKWTDKILWAIIALLIAATAADVKKIFTNDEKLDKMEQLMERQERRELKRVTVDQPTRAVKK